MGVFTCEVRSGMGVYFEPVLTGQPPINTVIPSKYSLTISSRNSFLFYSASGGLRRSCSNDRGDWHADMDSKYAGMRSVYDTLPYRCALC